MNLYLIVFLLLALGSLIEWFRPAYKKTVYWICWTAMTALLCFRYGQGTDYITYNAIYDALPMVFDWSKGYIFGVYPELGWRLLCAAFKAFHAPFWLFTMILGLGEMLLLHRVLTKYVPVRTAGLFLAYPVLFIVYMVSGLRQGLAMCLFLGLALPFYLEKKWVPYVISVLLASAFHRVGYIWLVLGVVYYLPVRVMAIFAGLSAVGGIFLQVGWIQQLIVGILPAYHVKQFLLEGSVSIFALGERVVSFLVLFGLYIWYKKKEGQADAKAELLMKAYMCGACLYLLMFGNNYYSSRYAVVFKVLECVMVVCLLVRDHWVSKGAAVFFFCLTLLMGVKNMNAMIGEGFYDASQVNLLTFPYVSVFHQDKINDYIPYDEQLPELYGYSLNDQELWRLEEESER